jgi:hypothetical protein
VMPPATWRASVRIDAESGLLDQSGAWTWGEKACARPPPEWVKHETTQCQGSDRGLCETAGAREQVFELTHEQCATIMSLVLDGEATPSEEAALDAHLAVCAPCMATWRRYRQLDRQLASAPLLCPPAGFAQGVVSLLEERKLVGPRLPSKERRARID